MVMDILGLEILSRSDIVDVWCDKFDENEKRKKIPISEKQIDDQLFFRIIKKSNKG